MIIATIVIATTTTSKDDDEDTDAAEPHRSILNEKIASLMQNVAHANLVLANRITLSSQLGITC